MAYVYVKLLNGFSRELLYKLPADLASRNLTEQCVLVPLRKQLLPAFVVRQCAQHSEQRSFEIREIVRTPDLPNDQLFHQFLTKVAALYFTNVLFLYEKLQFFIQAMPAKTKKEPASTAGLFEQTAEEIPAVHAYLPPLTDEQQAAANYITERIGGGNFAPALLHGLTGSGKTEVYKKIMDHAISSGKSVMLLLPEVSLASRFAAILRTQLPHISFFGYHSGSGTTEKKQLWLALQQNRPIVVIGVHLPVFLPISNLGAIIIDEEHEAGFEEKNYPKINSKFIALFRAQLYKIPILLGSATPSLHSLHSVRTRGWPLFKLTKRFAGSLPSITKVLLTAKGRRRSSFWLTHELEEAIAACLADGKQAMIYLNRRGYGFFLQCKPCGFIFQCPSCSVVLTAHSAAKQVSGLVLRCHYCDYQRRIPASCPQCSSTKPDFFTKGIGTQQMVEILQKQFPFASIARADLDTTKKASWEQTVQDFSEKKIDILVGTKTITKGYHFPHVTLVGIVWADLNIHIPHYSASEEALQQLIQVAGRAGRQHAGSRVVMQVMHDHPIFDFLAEDVYLDFAADELAAREETNYPPFTRLLQIELKHKTAAVVDQEALALAGFCRAMSIGPISVLGPALPAVSKIAKQEIRHIFIKAAQFSQLQQLVNAVQRKQFKSAVYFTPR